MEYKGKNSFFQPAYPDPFDISSAVPTAPAYVDDVLTFSLPVVNQVQVKEKLRSVFFISTLHPDDLGRRLMAGAVL